MSRGAARLGRRNPLGATIKREHDPPMVAELTETFDTADSDILGPLLSWRELTGDIDVVSNEASSASNLARAVALHKLTSADMWAQARVTTSEEANFARCNLAVRAVLADNANVDFYVFQMDFEGNIVRFFRTLDGTSTQIAATGAGEVPLVAGTYYTAKVEVRDVEDVLEATFEEGADEGILSASSTGIDTVSVAAVGNAVYDSAHPHSGSLGVRLSSAAQSGGNYLEWQTSMVATDEAWQRVYGYFTAAPPANLDYLGFYTNAAGHVARVRVNTDRSVSIVDSTNTVHATSATQLPLDAPFRLEFRGKIGAGTGEIECRIFTGGDLENPVSTPTETISTTTAQNGTTQINRARAGFNGHGVVTYTHWLDDWRTSVRGWLGPTGTVHPFLAPKLIGYIDGKRVLQYVDRDVTAHYVAGYRNRYAGFALQKSVTGTARLDDWHANTVFRTEAAGHGRARARGTATQLAIVTRSAQGRARARAQATSTNIVTRTAVGRSRARARATSLAIVPQAAVGRAKGRATATGTVFTPAVTVNASGHGRSRARATATLTRIIPATAAGRARARAHATDLAIVTRTAVGRARARAVATRLHIVLRAAQGRGKAFARATLLRIQQATAAGRSRARARATSLAIVTRSAVGRGKARSQATSTVTVMARAHGRSRARSQVNAQVVIAGVVNASAHGRAKARGTAALQPITTQASARGRAKARGTATATVIGQVRLASAHGRGKARSRATATVLVVAAPASGRAKAWARATPAQLTVMARAHGRARTRALAVGGLVIQLAPARGRARAWARAGVQVSLPTVIALVGRYNPTVTAVGRYDAAVQLVAVVPQDELVLAGRPGGE